jgi:hypothetical protein
VASKSLEEWLKILWENENEYVVSEVLSGAAESPFVYLFIPLVAGGSPPLL